MKSMRLAIIALACASVLGGCASGGIKNPIQQTQVYELENSYGVAQSAAIAYTKLPRCVGSTKLACSQAKVVVAIGEADKKARLALSAVEDFSRNPANYPTLSYGSLLSAASSAIGVLSALTK